MKKGENMDGNIKIQLPSMKTAKIVDGSTKTEVPSMKRAENMDGSRGEAALKVNDQKCNALKNLIENRSQTIAPVTQLREKKRTYICCIRPWKGIPVLICAYCRHDAQHNQKRAYSLFAWNYLEMLFMAMDDSDACKTLASGSMAQTEQKKGLRFLEDHLIRHQEVTFQYFHIIS